MQRLAFVTYETPHAPCGGIAAVMKHLPKAALLAAHLPTAVIAPCHYRVHGMKKVLARATRIGSMQVPCDDANILVHILMDLEDGSYFYLSPEDPRFFAGERHPYDLGATGEEIGANLLRDSLFFGAAVARALHVLAPGDQWGLFLQDWEAATTVLAMAENPGPHAVRLTLHNSYDCDVSDETLCRFGIMPASCPGTSILRRAVDLVDQPVTTVSRQFAHDLTEETLQIEIIAPHLQAPFRERPVVGVDNGPFAERAMPDELVDLAALGRFEGLHKWKTIRRLEFIRTIEMMAHNPDPARRPWGQIERFIDQISGASDAVWFVMGGRDDSRQKGYDLAVIATKAYLDQGGEGFFIFFPIPGDEGLPGLKFLQEFAESDAYSRRVIVFPFRFTAGFHAAQQGASFALMPSLYEPFGSANEFYLYGAVGIGRATGGISQQIVPARGIPSFSSSAELRSMRWHAANSQPTGFLFREPDALPTTQADWKAINAGSYDIAGGYPNRVQQRRRFPLVDAMALAFCATLKDAASLYRHDHIAYYKMLARGIRHIEQHFSWDKAAREYLAGWVDV